MGMESYADEPVSSYSSGMRQRLAIARSLLHQPQILFLDEPSRSLDPRATARLHQLIRDLVSDKRATVFLITHNLREAEDLCDRLAVMDQGRIQVIGEPADLRKRYQPWRHYTVQVDRLDSEIEQSLEQLLPKLDYTTTGELSRLSFKAGEDDGSLMAVLDFLGQNQVAIHSVDSHMPPLEEVFAHFTAT
jgi:ABC-2 type transport system ATP-binding protein